MGLFSTSEPAPAKGSVRYWYIDESKSTDANMGGVMGMALDGPKHGNGVKSDVPVALEDIIYTAPLDQELADVFKGMTGGCCRKTWDCTLPQCLNTNTFLCASCATGGNQVGSMVFPLIKSNPKSHEPIVVTKYGIHQGQEGVAWANIQAFSAKELKSTTGCCKCYTSCDAVEDPIASMMQFGSACVAFTGCCIPCFIFSCCHIDHPPAGSFKVLSTSGKYKKGHYDPHRGQMPDIFISSAELHLQHTTPSHLPVLETLAKAGMEYGTNGAKCLTTMNVAALRALVPDGATAGDVQVQVIERL